jgi:hypothetical protein
MTDEDQTDNERPVDVWKLIERSVVATPAQQNAESSGEDDAKDAEVNKRRWRRFRRLLDGISVLFWSYVIAQLFAFDVLRGMIGWIAPGHENLADLRWVVVLVGLLIAGVVWRWKLLGGALYVLFFPLILIFWKLPRFFYKRRSWILAIGFINAIGLFVRNLRYNLVTKVSAILAAAVILTVRNHVLLAAAALVIALLMSVASARTVRRMTEQNWFLTSQTRLIDTVIDSKQVTEFTDVGKHLTTIKAAKLDQTQMSSVTTAISASIAINRTLYFWAYQLRRYKQAGLNIAFSLASYAWLFVGCAIGFSLINIAILKIAPSQFSFAFYPSNLSMFVYGLSSLALNDGGGVTPVGNAADVVRLVAGLFGVLFLAVVVTQLLLNWRRYRDNIALDATVSTLKARAKAQDTRLHAQVIVGVDEAFKRLQTLGQTGLLVFISFMTVPEDFFE